MPIYKMYTICQTWSGPVMSAAACLKNNSTYYFHTLQYRQALFVVSVWMAKPVFVVSVLMAKPVFVVSVGLRVFQKI